MRTTSLPLARRALATSILAAAAVACSPADSPPGEGSSIGSTSSSIQNGTTDDNDHGIVAIVIQVPKVYTAICSGSLIAPNVVLTARHCVGQPTAGFITCGQAPVGSPFATGDFYVTTKAETPSDSRVYHRVQEVREAPGGNDVCGFDVALLILSAPIASSEATPLIPRVDDGPHHSETYSAAGYGATCADAPDATDCADQAGIRRRVDNLQLTCLGGECPTSVLTSSEWLGSKDVCEGDSGGPALDATGRIIGVASRGSDDDGGCLTPIYSRVDSWKAFLTQAVIDGAVLGGYDPPSWTGVTATPDAGTVATPEPMPDSAAPTQAEASPAAGTIGAPCMAVNDCAAPLLCVPEGPGYCAPPCSSGATLCPASYTCDVAAQVCRQAPTLQATSETAPHSSGGCSITVASPRSRDQKAPLATFLLVAIAAATARRRKH